MAGSVPPESIQSSFFDLNVEKVLEHWGIAEAVREVIANALDEQALTNTEAPVIEQSNDGAWHIRDFGRGLRYQHLTQNESAEKAANVETTLGKFGVGLKDALATFHRRGIEVLILSPHADFSLAWAEKAGFSIPTLHVVVDEPSQPGRAGTEFILEGLERVDIERAKDYFLHFSGEKVLEVTDLGTVLERGVRARIYVQGQRMATEERFLFGYNITSVTRQLSNALNRERSNVGRTAYQERVKQILLRCQSLDVMEPLAQDLIRLNESTEHDEITWVDVQEHAVRYLAAQIGSVFVSSKDLSQRAGMVEYARRDGMRIVTVPERLARRIETLKDAAGHQVLNLSAFEDAWNASFQFDFVDPSALTQAERRVWDLHPLLLRFAGPYANRVRRVRVSNTMRLTSSGSEAEGLWQGNGQIVIKRSCLDNPRHFAGVLLHEVGHASSGAGDVSARFEDALTKLLGMTGAAAAG